MGRRGSSSTADRSTRRRVLGVVLVGCALAATSATAATASESGSHNKPLRFALVLPDLNNPFISAQRDGAVAEAKKYGIQLLVKGSNNGSDQVNAFETYIGAKVNFLGINTIDGKAMGPAVAKANGAHIPVISMQSAPASGKLVTFIASNNFKTGQLIGQAIVKYCAKINPCKLGIVQGSFADPSGVDENNGVLSVIKSHPNIVNVGGSPTNYDPSAALNVASDLLTAHPDLNYIYSWWDQGALAAAQAVKSKGRAGKVGVSGFSGSCPAVQAVIKGDLYQDALEFPDLQGKIYIDTARQYLAGKSKFPKFTEIKAFSLTHDYAVAALAGKVTPPTDRPILATLKRAKAGCK
jgi:ABC-type sugar transport system substrate-binding protein